MTKFNYKLLKKVRFYVYICGVKKLTRIKCFFLKCIYYMQGLSPDFNKS